MTPPETPASEGLDTVTPPPGLTKEEFPAPSSDMPLRHEERAIDRSNLKHIFGQGRVLNEWNAAIANDNMRHVFGPEVEFVPIIDWNGARYRILAP